MQISRNKGATKKASRKMVHYKVFFITFWPKGYFSPQNGGTTKTNFRHKSVQWYQCISLWKMLGGGY